MEVGAPNSEPGSRGEAGIAGSRREAVGSDPHLTGDVRRALGSVRMRMPSGRLSEGARESRGARPGLT
jgi:hypothetical protein